MSDSMNEDYIVTIYDGVAEMWYVVGYQDDRRNSIKVPIRIDRVRVTVLPTFFSSRNTPNLQVVGRFSQGVVNHPITQLGYCCPLCNVQYLTVFLKDYTMHTIDCTRLHKVKIL